MNKNIFNRRSKTHWVTVTTAVVGGLFNFLPQVREFVSPELFGNTLIILGVTYHVLRNITNTDIESK